MKNLLSSPVKMSLSATENQIYQNALKYVTPLSLNLMAVKVEHRPDDFAGWCGEVIRLCREDLNRELLDEEQFAPLKKLQEILEAGFTVGQCKMARTAPWPIFVNFIEQQDTLHALDERLRLMSYIDNIRQQPLADLTIEDRLAFAGKHTSKHDHLTYDFDIEWFASTKAAKVFHVLLEQSPEKIDAALAHIPLTGDVNYEEYQKFVTDFQQIFNDYSQENSVKSKAPLAAATRLLAMRRPDQFIALNNNKIEVLCKGLSISKFTNTDFSSYWDDMIGALRTSPWWSQAEPEVSVEESTEESGTVNRELALWNNRAVLIDLFLFADADLSQNSNYIRARDKALNKKPAKPRATSKSRSKESAEVQVDKALTAEDLPVYMINKRDSLISQVKAGKSPEQAIALMRAIFG